MIRVLSADTRASFRRRMWMSGGRPGAHAVVARIVLQLSEPEVLHDGRHVVRAATAQALLDPIPPADRVLGGARPCLDGSVRGGFLLVGAAERQPVAMLGEHRVEILDA